MSDAYDGPIEPGMCFWWEPESAYAFCEVRVTRLADEGPGGERLIYATPSTGRDAGNEYGNNESRFREAVVLIPVTARGREICPKCGFVRPLQESGDE